MGRLRMLLVATMLGAVTVGATGCAGLYADSNGTTCVIIVAVPICA